MIDRLVSRFSHAKHSRSMFRYDASKVLLGTELLNHRAERLAVVFPPWHGVDRLMPLIERRARKLGTAALVFKFHDRILSTDTDETLESFKSARDIAIPIIKQVHQRYREPEVHLIGYSLGNVALAMTAGRLPMPWRATTVVGSSSLAASTWESRRTRHIMLGISIEQGKSLEYLEDKWEGLAPATYAHSFAGQEVHMVVATRDHIIPSAHQEGLVTTMTEAGANVSVDRLRLGHVATMVNFSFTGQL